jgi:hypothetical protein
MVFEPPKVAAIVTEYRPLSHADVLITKLLEGYDLFYTRVEPGVQVVSLYTDQVPENDTSREIAGRNGVPIYPSIKEALTLGGDTLAVDGVILVGEHGDYPLNEKEQHLYPRRRFFEETVAVFRESGRVVPVFSDKHLSWSWEEAKWMVDTAKEMGIPFMAGSSVPVGPRWPPLQVPMGAEVEEALVIGHGPIESYGYHLLEGMQALVERRRGHETGVASVQCLDGDRFWEAWEVVNGGGDGKGRWGRDLQEAALALNPHPEEHPREYYARRRAEREARAAAAPVSPAPAAPPQTVPSRQRRPIGEGIAFLVEHLDGLRTTTIMLSGYVGKRTVALRLKGQDEPWAVALSEGAPPTTGSVLSDYVNFSHLGHVIELLVQRGKAIYPVERTLLVTGVLEAAMTSRFEGGRRIETPHLDVRYAPPGVRGPAAS